MRAPILGNPAFPSQRDGKARGHGLGHSAVVVLWLTLAAIAAWGPVLQAQTLPITVADFNHDGLPDVLVQSTTTPTATIVFGSVPYGSFSGSAKGVTFPAACTSLGQGSVLVGDLNGDGFPDIVFFCQTSSGVLAGTMLGNGDGTFGAAATVQGVYSSTAVLGDFNQDGKLDLAVIGPNGASDGPLGIEFFAGNGDGTFAAPVVSLIAAATPYTSPVAVDVNGDGYPDLVLGNFTSMQGPLTIAVFGNNQNGTFGVAGPELQCTQRVDQRGHIPGQRRRLDPRRQLLRDRQHRLRGGGCGRRGSRIFHRAEHKHGKLLLAGSVSQDTLPRAARRDGRQRRRERLDRSCRGQRKYPDRARQRRKRHLHRQLCDFDPGLDGDALRRRRR